MSFNKILFASLLAAFAAGAPVSVPAQQSATPSLSQRLGELLSPSAEDELIEPDLAFTAKASAVSASMLAVELVPAPGYYLYRNRIHFALKDAKGVKIKAVKLPKGTPKKDPTFGTTETYSVPVRADLTLERSPGVRSVTLTASYQGCHEKTGVCYPPMTKELVVALP